MGQRKQPSYSEEFQAMLDRLEEEDYADRSSGQLCMKKSRLCIEQVKALEKYFEMDNKLQPERKVRIAEEIGLEPRQVAIWFQNRRARWKAKQLEKEYNKLRANYDTLKHDYGSLEQEKQALLSQLKDLKTKIEAKTHGSNTTSSISPPLNYSDAASYESTSMNMHLSGCSNSSSCQTFNPFPLSSSQILDNGYQLCRANYHNQSMRAEEMGMFNHEESCNFFSVDQAPTLHWYPDDQSFSRQ